MAFERRGTRRLDTLCLNPFTNSFPFARSVTPCCSFVSRDLKSGSATPPRFRGVLYLCSRGLILSVKLNLGTVKEKKTALRRPVGKFNKPLSTPCPPELPTFDASFFLLGRVIRPRRWPLLGSRDGRSGARALAAFAPTLTGYIVPSEGLVCCPRIKKLSWAPMFEFVAKSCNVCNQNIHWALVSTELTWNKRAVGCSSSSVCPWAVETNRGPPVHCLQ